MQGFDMTDQIENSNLSVNIKMKEKWINSVLFIVGLFVKIQLFPTQTMKKKKRR